MADSKRICVVEDCNKPTGVSGSARGMCRSHYSRWYKYGDPAPRRTDTNARPQWIDANKDFNGKECLTWPFSRKEDGRGQFKIDGRSTSASRAMCIAAHGEPPTPLHVAAHSCGKGHEGCVNPKHLRWATHSENEMDKVIHGTIIRGSDVKSAKLTEIDVLKIRSLAQSLTHEEIAKQTKVSRTQVSRIIRRERWGWLK